MGLHLNRAILAGLALGFSASVAAQGSADTAAATPGGVSDQGELPTVVVTATRRSQNIDTVPVAVSEVGGDALEQNVVRDTQSLLMAVPELNVSVSGSENAGSTIRIRGVGTTGSNAGFESAVGVFVDGVYLPRPAIALQDLVDINNVQVLRGPQSTLFGKNTSGGVIAITTNKPTFQPEASVSASYGNLDATIGNVMFNAPLTDKLAVRFAGQYDYRDGYIHNLTDGTNYDNRNRYLLRGQALYQVLDNLSFRLIADYQHKSERCCAAPYTINGPASALIAGLGGTVLQPPSYYTTAFDSQVESDAELKSVSGHMEWDLSGMQLHALLSYQDAKGNDAADGDYNDLNLLYLPTNQSRLSEKTAEVTLHGRSGPVDWLGGAFYSNEHIDVFQQQLLGTDAAAFLTYGTPAYAFLYPAGTGQTNTTANQRSDSWSLFTHNVVDLGAGFDMTLGLRYLVESKNGGGQAATTSPSCNALYPLPASARVLCGAPPYSADYGDHRFAGTAAFGKKIGRAYLYVSYSNGFKAGGINLNPPSTVAGGGGAPVFQPEKVDAGETGIKLPGLLGNRMQVRADLFWERFKDFQINTFNGTSFVPSNVGEVYSRGAEFEGDYRPLIGLTLHASATYAYAIYGDDTINPPGQSLRGNQLTNAPRWTVVAQTEYEHPLPWLSNKLGGATTAFVGADMRFQTKVNTGSDLDPNKEQGAYALLNARTGLNLPQDWQVSLWGQNLTDRHYYQVIFNSVAQTGSYNGYPGVPRTYGIQVSKHFF